MTKRRLGFCHFWPGFPMAKNFFTEVLRPGDTKDGSRGSVR